MLNHGRFAASAAFGLLLAASSPAPSKGQSELPVPVSPAPVLESDRTLEQSDRLEESANQLLGQGEFDAALTDLQKSRRLRASVMGEQHWVIRTADETIKDLTRIGTLPGERRKAAHEAIQKWKACLNAPDAAPTPEHAGKMTACCKPVCEILGPASCLSLEARVQLAQALAAARQFAECQSTAAECAEGTKKLLGENHPWYAFSLSLQATAYGELAQWEEARKVAGLALRANEHLWGEDTPPCGLCFLTLSWIDINRKNYEAARRHADNALHALAPEQEQDPANYALAKARLAHALSELGKHAEAREQYITLVEFVEKNDKVPDDLQEEVNRKYSALLQKLGRTAELEALESGKVTK